VTLEHDELAAAARRMQSGAFDRAAAGTVAGAAARIADHAERGILGAMAPHRRSGRMAGQVRRSLAGAGVGTVATVTAGGLEARLLTGGTRPHAIAAVRAGALAIRGAGSLSGFASSVRHPGTRPDPVVARGLAAAARDIDTTIDRTADELADELADVAGGRD
jgi:hypothetical protein